MRRSALVLQVCVCLSVWRVSMCVGVSVWVWVWVWVYVGDVLVGDDCVHTYIHTYVYVLTHTAHDLRNG